MTDQPFILLSPVGEISDAICETLGERLEKVFGFQIRRQALLADIEFAFDDKRNQYYSTRILEKLETLAPDGCVKVLAVTKEDLFIPILTHVYGEAQLNGRSSIISISRLMAGPESGGLETSMDRIVKEAIHELGHTFDLRHCDDDHCIMHYCRKIEDVDHKLGRFCRYCNIFLSDAVKALGL